MNIAILSCVTGDRYDWQTEVTNPFKEAYCMERDYEYIYIKYEKSPLNRHPYWDRIWYLERELPKYDAIMWMDADAAPVKFEYRLEDLIGRGGDFWISPETQSGRVYFNVGSFIVKNSEWGRWLLKMWGSEGVWKEFKGHGNPEQDALTELYHRGLNRIKEHIKVLGRNEINSVGVGCGKVWRRGDFVKHLACGKNREKFKEAFWHGLDVGYFERFGVRK